MTLLLRVLSMITAFIAVVFIAMPVLMIGHGSSPVRDGIAIAVYLVFGVLAARCSIWLWRKRRFWTEVRSLSEVTAFSCLIVLWPIVVLFERRTVGVAKDAVHVATITSVILVYVFVQRRGLTKRAPSAKPVDGTTLAKPRWSS